MEARTWNTEGWDYYPKLDNVISTYAINAKHLTDGVEDDDDEMNAVEEGFWASGEHISNPQFGYWTVGDKNNTGKAGLKNYQDLTTSSADGERMMSQLSDTTSKSRSEHVKQNGTTPREVTGNGTIGDKKRYIDIWGIQRFPKAKVVTLGLRLYIEGNVYLKVTYFDKQGRRFRKGKDMGTKKIEGFGRGICSIILDLPTSATNIEKVSCRLRSLNI